MKKLANITLSNIDFVELEFSLTSKIFEKSSASVWRCSFCYEDGSENHQNHAMFDPWRIPKWQRKGQGFPSLNNDIYTSLWTNNHFAQWK